MPAQPLNNQEVPAGLKVLAQQLPAPSAETLAELIAVQPEKREAFDAGWVTWNTGYTTNISTATSATTSAWDFQPAWGAWNVTFTSTTGSTMVYDAGSNTAIPVGGSFTITAPQWVTWSADYQETEDQRAAREERDREVRERQRERQAEMEARAAEQRLEREQAESRALELLRSLLSDAQWASYQDNGWFEVRGKSGRRWRVRNRGQSGNVDLMPEIGEERDVTYCAHPPEHLPDADAHAAQMLALVTDDEAFIRTANVHWRRRPEGEVPPFMREAA